MKIAFIYGKFSLGNAYPRYINFANLWDDPRGLTGSEVSCIKYAIEMKKLGHDVSLWIPNPGAVHIEDVQLFNTDVKHAQLIHEGYDVVYSWNEPDYLRSVDPKVLRVVNQQLNDWMYCRPGFQNYVDLFTSPSKTHKLFLLPQVPSAVLSEEMPLLVDRWIIIPNGCDPVNIDFSKKVPGRIVYTSSPDRGLHLVMQEWPHIKKACPNAHLRIYYHGLMEWIDHVSKLHQHPDPTLREQAARASYMKMALPKLKRLDVEYVGSVSRNQMKTVLAEAQVFAYPCDTVRFTEGFSVSTLEACAAGVCPVISDVDALGEVYAGVAMVKAPAHEHMQEWREKVISVLQENELRHEQAILCNMLSKKFEWPKLAKQLEFQLAKALSVKTGNGSYLAEVAAAEIAIANKDRFESDFPPAIIGVTKESVPEMARVRQPDCSTKGLINVGYSIKRFLTPNVQAPVSYKVACIETFSQHPSWFSFEDEESVRKRFWRIKEGDVIFDVGAAYGSYSLSALAMGASEVIAWSPQGGKNEESEAYFLRKSLQLNNWVDRCTIYERGVFDKHGVLNTMTQEYLAQPSVPEGTISHDANDWIVVAPLDYYNLNVRPQNRLWMKLDVEGAEIEVLQGAKETIKRCRPLILVEHHNFKRATLEKEVMDLLRSWNYYCEAVVPYHAVSHGLYIPNEKKGTV